MIALLVNSKFDENFQQKIPEKVRREFKVTAYPIANRKNRP